MRGFRPTLPQLAVAVLVVAAVAFFAAHRQRARSELRDRLVAAVRAVPLDVPAPAARLWRRDGTSVPLDSYRGRLVFVNFWATWCGPCKQELPSLVAFRGAFDPGSIAFVAIAEDDTWPPLDAFLRQTPLPFDVYRDQPPRVETLFETTSYPTSFLLDADGRALYRFNGARDWNTPELRALFELEGARLSGE